MKLLLPLLILLSLLSCSEKADKYDLLFKKEACARSIAENESLYARIKEAVDLGELTEDSVLFQDCKQIVSRRRTFMDRPGVEALKVYADSVAERYAKLEWKDVRILAPITELKNSLSAAADSTAYYNLLYFTSVAESHLLENNAKKNGVVCFLPYLTSYLNKKEYSPSETVYLTLWADEKELGEHQLDFSKVTCSELESGTTLQPAVVRTGPHYILMFQPTEAGTYHVAGEVVIKRAGNFEAISGILNTFEVVAGVVPEKKSNLPAAAHTMRQ